MNARLPSLIQFMKRFSISRRNCCVWRAVQRDESWSCQYCGFALLFLNLSLRAYMKRFCRCWGTRYFLSGVQVLIVSHTPPPELFADLPMHSKQQVWRPVPERESICLMNVVSRTINRSRYYNTDDHDNVDENLCILTTMHNFAVQSHEGPPRPKSPYEMFNPKPEPQYTWNPPQEVSFLALYLVNSS